MSVSRRLKFAQDALKALVAALDVLADSAEKAGILADARECEQIVARWREEPPGQDQHERVMKRILALHVAAAKLRRPSRHGGTPSGQA